MFTVKKMCRLAAYACLLLLLVGPTAAAQKDDGGSTRESKPGAPPPKPTTPKGGASVRPKRVTPRLTGPRPTTPQPACDDGEIVVNCGTPNCEVVVNGDVMGVTDEQGTLRLEAERGAYALKVRKTGYEEFSKNIRVGCGEPLSVAARLARRSVAVRLRTSEPNCDIYVNLPPTLQGRSDADGLFVYQTSATQLLVEARKSGFQSSVENVTVTPELEKKELLLKLKPVPAALTVTANVAGARVQLAGRPEAYAAGEMIQLPPGRHRLKVGALGYASQELDLTTAPNETVKRAVSLERLSVEQLAALADSLLKERAYGDALVVCGYVFETDAAHAGANRIAGAVHLARQNYAEAAPHFERALAGGERLTFQVRRHARESFDPVKGHDACAATLTLGKTEVEFQAQQWAGENFRVPYASLQVVGPQLKKAAYVYLGTKVADAQGKRRDYNFYGYDKELSQTSANYLKMLQQLLRPH